MNSSSIGRTATWSVAAQLGEIRDSRALQLFGVALAGTLLLTAHSWWTIAPTNLAAHTIPLCWPYADFCVALRPLLTTSVVLALVGAMAATAIGAAFGFLLRHVRIGCGLLAISLCFKVFLFLQDYRFMGNYHYMPYWLFAVYFCVPHKKTALPWLIVSFYFFAGTLKLNAEWLSGAALLRPSVVAPSLLPWLLKYAVFLECVVVFGLVSRNTWIFRFAFANMIAFHVFSWHIVGSFYPLTMFHFRAFFPVLRGVGGWVGIDELWQRRPLPTGATLTLATFALLNGYGWFLPGERALTGDGRMLSLNMLDAMPSCTAQMFARYDRMGVQETVEWTNTLPELAPRIRCDPVTFWNVARRLCEEESHDPEFKGLDLAVRSKKSTDVGYRRLIAEEDFCAQDLRLGIVWPTPWVRKEAPEHEAIAHKPAAARLGVSQSFRDVSSHPPTASSPAFFREDEARTGISKDHTPLAILDLKPVWRQPIGNVGIHSAVKASPVVDASGVYVGSDSSWFFKISHDGEARWRFRPGPADRGIHATAALDDERVYLGTYSGDIYALEKETGRIVWMIDVGDTLGASFLMLDDSLIANVETFQPNGFLARIGRARGTVEWVSDLVGEQGHASPAFHRQTGLLFAGFNNFDLVGFSAATGETVWKKKALNFIKTTPLVWEDLVIYSASDGWLRAAAVADGHDVWATSLTEAPFLASPSYEPTTNTLILQSTKGELFGVDPHDGHTKWQRQLNGSIRLAGSALIVPTTAGHVAILGCGPAELCAFTGDGTEVKRWSMGGRVSSQPARFQDSLYVTEEARNGESGHLVKLGPGP